MKKGKIIVILIILAVLIGAGIFFVQRFLKKDDKEEGRLVYVESVAMITGHGTGISNRFMGIVEAQETKKVEKDDTKKINEIFVNVGDSVKEGDPLFSYNTEDMKLDLQQLELELDNIKNSIESDRSRINDLAEQREKVPDEDKLSITSQINNISATIKQEEYELSTKQLEIERQKEAIDSAVVSSPMSGTVKKINKNSESGGGYNDMDTDNSFITIMADGDFRIKGTVSENNIYDLTVGMPVIIRSRVDENMIWNGTISKIDLEPQQNNNSEYYYGGGMGESASKYTFYVKIDSFDGLMLGQHLYIEMDYGQGEVQEGLNIPSYYFVIDGSDYYIWVRDKDKKIEKRKVTVGEYDEGLDTYEILSGLTEDDYIAFPDVNVKEGNKTTTNYEDIIDQMNDQGESFDGGMSDDGMIDDGMYENAMPDGEMIPEDGMFDNGMPEDGMYELPDGSMSSDPNGVLDSTGEEITEQGNGTVPEDLPVDGADSKDGGE